MPTENICLEFPDLELLPKTQKEWENEYSSDIIVLEDSAEIKLYCLEFY
jgi:hypothetical protein